MPGWRRRVPLFARQVLAVFAPGTVTSGGNPSPSGQLAEPAPDGPVKPIPSDTSDTDATPTDPSLTSGKTPDSSARPQATPKQPASPSPRPTHPRTPPPDTNPPQDASPQSQPQTQPQTQPAKPAVSATELDDARERFIRLRSRALALKSSLGELRQRLAVGGMSVSNDAVEAENNMDSYMLEADRALQAGDVQTAGTNMDRAEHEAKKISALFGR